MSGLILWKYNVCDELDNEVSTIMLPLSIWLEGGSKKNVLLVNIGFRVSADTSVCFFINMIILLFLRNALRWSTGNLLRTLHHVLWQIISMLLSFMHTLQYYITNKNYYRKSNFSSQFINVYYNQKWCRSFIFFNDDIPSL